MYGNSSAIFQVFLETACGPSIFAQHSMHCSLNTSNDAPQRMDPTQYKRYHRSQVYLKAMSEYFNQPHRKFEINRISSSSDVNFISAKVANATFLYASLVC